MPPRFSLVIPAFDEAGYLPRLLESVDVARRSYARGPDAVEVIVADNASTDATADIARARGCTVVRVEQRAIAAARNGGGRAAVAEILAFVDADSVLHPGTFDAIDRAMTGGGVVVGATGVRVERMSPGIAVSWAVSMAIVRLANMDTGVVFCRRSDWEAVGGYDERRRYAEDVRLMFDLKRLGRRRGERFVRLRGVEAVTSTRKFDRHGDWHYFQALLNPALLLSRAYRERFVQRYWYER